MAIPNAPLEGGGDKIIFLLSDSGASLMRGYATDELDGEGVAELGVYPTSGYLGHGCQTLGGSTAEAITTTLPCAGVLIKAASTNTGTIYVGIDTVTTDYNDSTGGYPLDPGESVGVPCRDAAEVYIRGTSGDKVAWIASVH